MTTTCPNAEDLVRFVDGALSVDRTQRVQAHVERCARCREEVATLHRLVGDLGAPIPGALDVEAHKRAILERLETPVRERRRAPSLTWAVASALVAAAVVLVAHRSSRGVWQSRGGIEHVAAQEVSVRPCEIAGGIRFLSEDAEIRPDAALTATFRNLRPEPVYLLLLAVDAAHVVHWIAPRFEQPGEDPVSVALRPTIDDAALDATVVFDDLATGPLRIFAVITSTPARVSQVESMDASALDRATLEAHIPGAIDVRETTLTVDPRGTRDR